MEWLEFTLEWPPTEHEIGQEFFRRTKEIVIPSLQKAGIAKFMITHYWDRTRPNGETKVRIEVDSAQTGLVSKMLDQLKNEEHIDEAILEEYDPRIDAENRLKGVRTKLGTSDTGTWSLPESRIELPKTFESWEDILDVEKMDQLTCLFGGGVGRCTEAIVDVLEHQPESPWVVSVLLHLILNSLGYSGPDSGMEPVIRLTFPL